MHVISFEVQNYLRVEAFHITPEGKHVIISARNGEGKTSVVTALFDILCGISQKKQTEPVHRGADKAYQRLELEDYIIEKHIKNGVAPKLKVTKKDGTKVLSPQKLLEGWVNTFALDPVAWRNLRPQDQLDKVLEVYGVKPPVEKVKEITGVDHPAMPDDSANTYLMKLSADDTGYYYLARRDMGRQVDECSGAVAKQHQLIQNMPPLGEMRSAAAIMDEITELETAQATYQAKLNNLAGQRNKIREANTLMADCTRQRDRAGESKAEQEAKIKAAELVIEEQKRKIEAARAVIAEAEATSKTLSDRIAKGRQIIADLEAEAKAEEQALAGLDRTEQIAALRQEWKQADAMAAELIRREQAEQRLVELQADHAARKNRHDRLDIMLTKLRKLRSNLLEGVDLGVEGLSVGDGQLLLNDLPFSQASMAQSLRVALDVIMRQNADLKLIRIDNGEMLDAESTRLVLKTATERGWQVIMTRVSNDKELRVEIVDGEAQ